MSGVAVEGETSFPITEEDLLPVEPQGGGEVFAEEVGESVVEARWEMGKSPTESDLEYVEHVVHVHRSALPSMKVSVVKAFHDRFDVFGLQTSEYPEIHFFYFP